MIIMFDHETLMQAGPGLTFLVLCFAAYAIAVNLKDRDKDK